MTSKFSLFDQANPVSMWIFVSEMKKIGFVLYTATYSVSKSINKFHF